MNIGIIGNGVVGHATARCLSEFHTVRVYDTVPEKCVNLLEDVLNCDLIFVCVPEAALAPFFKHLPETHRKQNFVVRSTVPVGTTRQLRHTFRLTNVVHSPEFLTTRTALTDAHLPSRLIVGGEFVTGPSLQYFYEKRFPGVPVLTMTSDESEYVKLCTNAVFAVKIALFNEFRVFADRVGVDWDTVLTGVLADGRIAHSHTKVPGPDGKYGFGGTCLVKDLKQLVDQMMLVGGVANHGTGAKGAPLLTATALLRNEIDRKRGGE